MRNNKHAMQTRKIRSSALTTVLLLLLISKSGVTGSSSTNIISDVGDSTKTCTDGEREDSGECTFHSSLMQGDEHEMILHDSVQDLDENCQEMAERGDCNSNPQYMLTRCIRSCLSSFDLGSIGYFEDESHTVDDDSDCIDEHVPGDTYVLEEDGEQELLSSCEEYAADGECLYDDEFMSEYCSKTCLACYPPGTEIFDIGVPQLIDSFDRLDETLEIIIATNSYMSDVMYDDELIFARADCRNKNELCSDMAAQGYCEDYEHELYMTIHCSPACNTCDLLANVCPFDESTNIFQQQGDLNRMFERLVGEAEPFNGVPNYNFSIHSRPSHPPEMKLNNKVEGQPDGEEKSYIIGPWVITIDEFLTDEECDHLIELGALEGYQQSTLQEEDIDEETGETISNLDDYRTSVNSWCMEDCYNDPIAQKIMERITNATGIPEGNAEYLQLLKYSPGQYYKEHHDFTFPHQYLPPGPRIITFFLYLNNVEKGGGTRFNDLGDGISIDIQPKKGMALVWPSVLDENPVNIDDRTFHEALVVEQGEKYGANAWFHLRSYKDDDCEYY